MMFNWRIIKIHSKNIYQLVHYISAGMIHNQHFTCVPFFWMHVSHHEPLQRNNQNNTVMRKNMGGAAEVRTILKSLYLWTWTKVWSSTLCKVNPRELWPQILKNGRKILCIKYGPIKGSWLDIGPDSFQRIFWSACPFKGHLAWEKHAHRDLPNIIRIPLNSVCPQYKVPPLIWSINKSEQI